jgi:hypothetical protein
MGEAIGFDSIEIRAAQKFHASLLFGRMKGCEDSIP